MSKLNYIDCYIRREEQMQHKTVQNIVRKLDAELQCQAYHLNSLSHSSMAEKLWLRKLNSPIKDRSFLKIPHFIMFSCECPIVIHDISTIRSLYNQNRFIPNYA